MQINVGCNILWTLSRPPSSYRGLVRMSDNYKLYTEKRNVSSQQQNVVDTALQGKRLVLAIGFFSIMQNTLTIPFDIAVYFTMRNTP